MLASIDVFSMLDIYCDDNYFVVPDFVNYPVIPLPQTALFLPRQFLDPLRPRLLRQCVDRCENSAEESRVIRSAFFVIFTQNNEECIFSQDALWTDISDENNWNPGKHAQMNALI
jgi:hypothetical protein